MQNCSSARATAQHNLQQLRVATFSGGVSANDNGASFEDGVLPSLVAAGFRHLDAASFAGVDPADGDALMARAYRKDGLLGEQALFKGVAIPQLYVRGCYGLTGHKTLSRRDLVLALENGRKNLGALSSLSFHIELKYQMSSGTADDKAKGMADELLAGCADYSMCLWDGIGAVSGAHEYLHQSAQLSDDIRALINKRAAQRDPRTQLCAGQFFYASTKQELLSQILAIIDAEARGHRLTYAEWRLGNPFVNPSDVRKAARLKKERRQTKEAAGVHCAKEMMRQPLF